MSETIKEKRVFPTRVAGQKRWEREDLWRQSIELPLPVRAALVKESELSGEFMSDIIRVAIERELKRRDKARVKKNAASAA